jgi:hypothetical protein
MAALVRGRKVNQGKTRRPSYNYHLKQRPWQIQPFFIAPVLPGERVKNMLWKQTAVSDPLINRLIGWWQETHLFYVRARDLFPASTALVTSIFVDPNANLSSLATAADAAYFHNAGVNWTKEAVRLIVENYFRADDESPDDAVIDGLWAATIGTDNFMDSLDVSANFAAEDVQLDIGTDHIFGMAELEKAQRFYELMKAGSLTDMNYEDYLRANGVNVPSQELAGKPRHLASFKNWTMPTNTIEPTTGVASTAVYWKEDGRYDKDMLVKEPGFLIGLNVFRPKVYNNQAGSVSGLMDTALDWLPFQLRDDPTSSMIAFADGTGPFAAALLGQDAMFDMRDYLIYGEQFTNIPLANLPNKVNLPTVNTAASPDIILKRYPGLQDAKNVFKDFGGTAQFLESDGRIDLTIEGGITDTSPPVARLEV